MVIEVTRSVRPRRPTTPPASRNRPRAALPWELSSKPAPMGSMASGHGGDRYTVKNRVTPRVMKNRRFQSKSESGFGRLRMVHRPRGFGVAGSGVGSSWMPQPWSPSFRPPPAAVGASLHHELGHEIEDVGHQDDAGDPGTFEHWHQIDAVEQHGGDDGGQGVVNLDGSLDGHHHQMDGLLGGVQGGLRKQRGPLDRRLARHFPGKGYELLDVGIALPVLEEVGHEPLEQFPAAHDAHQPVVVVQYQHVARDHDVAVLELDRRRADGDDRITDGAADPAVRVVVGPQHDVCGGGVAGAHDQVGDLRPVDGALVGADLVDAFDSTDEADQAVALGDEGLASGQEDLAVADLDVQPFAIEG